MFRTAFVNIRNVPVKYFVIDPNMFVAVLNQFVISRCYSKSFRTNSYLIRKCSVNFILPTAEQEEFTNSIILFGNAAFVIIRADIRPSGNGA